MDRLELYDVLNFILNYADSGELEAVRAALRRREGDLPEGAGAGGRGPRGIDLRKTAKQTADRIEDQLGASKQQLRGMVHDMVRQMISREAPELDDGQVDELFRGMVEPPNRSKADGRPGKAAGTDIPRDALITMLGQFISYATGSMPVREEMELSKQISDWQRRYWERFPQVVRRLVSLFLEGAMDSDEFWRAIEDALGGSPSADGEPPG